MHFRQKVISLVVFLTALSVPLIHAQASDGSDLFVVIVNDKRGYIDRTGKIVIEPKWAGANNFSEGLAVVAVDSPGYKEGYIDATGKLVIAATFDDAGDFENGLALVGIGEFGLHGSGDHKFGFIDRDGKWVIRPTYRTMYGFSEGLAAAMNDDGKWGFIDKTGKVVIPFQFEVGSFFSDGLARMFSKEKSRFGYIDRSGKWVIEPQFFDAFPFVEGSAVVKSIGKLSNPYPGGMTIGERDDEERQFLIIDRTGKTVFTFDKTVRRVQAFSEGLAVVEVFQKKGPPLTGFVDTTGKFILPPKYPFVDNFQDGLAQFLLDGKWTFMDKTGKVIFSTDYQVSYGFKRGLAFVYKLGPGGFGDLQNEKYGYIDKTGKVIWQPTK
jgi:hypothetical protein